MGPGIRLKGKTSKMGSQPPRNKITGADLKKLRGGKKNGSKKITKKS